MPVMEQEKIARKSFKSPDETRVFDKGRSEIVSVEELTLSHTVFEPGWKWSTNVKPLVGGESCQVRHIGYMLSGHLHTVMDDGTELDFGPGDVALIPAGHYGWTIGDEPAVLLQIAGAAEFAKK